MSLSPKISFKKFIKNLTFIDLFAGIGGFHYALHKLGLKCVFASEINKDARNSYQTNFNKISPDLFQKNNFNDDIYNQEKKQIPNFDICCGGFPCQPFSQIGKKKGFKENFESRGNLFFQITEILKIKKPKAFLLENVQHLINHDNGKTFKTIKETIEKLNYSFYYKVIRASDFNLPQNRPRAFMVGFYNEKEKDKQFQFPKPIKLKKTMSDIFNGKCNKEIGFTLRLGGAGSGINDRRNWDRYLVNGKERQVLPEQGLKMQGFPNNHFLSESKRISMKLLGNSVAVNVVKYITLEMLEYMYDKKKYVLKKGNKQFNLDL
jgi:DNA (cytosine-5)-methyltransferase 1